MGDCMSLKRNDVELLKLINNNPKTLEEILLTMKMSERNLRYIIDNLNFYLNKFCGKIIIICKKKLLISLIETEINSFLDIIYEHFYIFDQNERSEYILLNFLFLKNIRLTNIETNLKITRATLKKDIDHLNIELQKYNLKLDSLKNKFFIFGNEKKLRHLKAQKFLEYYNNKIFNYSNIFEEIDFILIEKLKEIVIKIEERFHFKFNSEFKELITIFLLVSIKRIENGYIITRKANYNFLINTSQYKIIKENLKSYIPESLSYELVHLTEYFISAGVKDTVKELKEHTDKYINNLTLVLKENIIEDINFNILKVKISEYLIPAIYRLRNNFSIGNVGEKDKFYYIVESFSNKENYLPENLTENEIYYISNIIKKEYESDKNKVIKLKDILTLTKKNCTNLNEESFINDLLSLYGEFIKNY